MNDLPPDNEASVTISSSPSQEDMLLARHHISGRETADSDLVSGMLTAVRDFVHDSFGCVSFT